MKTDDEFAALSEKVKQCMQKGNFPDLTKCYSAMSEILHKEGKYNDEMKLLMCIFHFKLAGLHSKKGQPEIGKKEADRCKWIAQNTGKNEKDLVKMYADVIEPNITPLHIMTNRGATRIFEMVLEGKTNKAQRVLTIADNGRNPVYDG